MQKIKMKIRHTILGGGFHQEIYSTYFIWEKAKKNAIGQLIFKRGCQACYVRKGKFPLQRELYGILKN